MLVACLLLFLCQVGCITHLRGVVIDPATNRPLPSAIFTDGSPDNKINFVKYPVDADGRFDFRFPTLDKSWIFIWNGQGVPNMVYRKIDPSEFGTDMVVHFSPTLKNNFYNQLQLN